MTRAATAWRAVRPFRGLVLAVITYAIVRAVFAHVAGDRGLVTPSGAVDGHVMVLGIATLALRAIVLVAVPFVVVYRAVTWLLGRLRAPEP